MNDKNKGIWNGGKTNINKEEARIFRQMEDQYDITDSEKETREELVERQKIMDESRIERKPIHELYKGLNQRVDLHKTKVTGMGGHQMKDSDRFNKVKK
tara:strand:+ start:180 stop:476 length:297 start_codon:yes stop_codon:yes gene_type:complete